jgi:hypothetical protein
LNWATSKAIGAVSELAVLTPVRKGCPPQENRTYEQRLREVIDNIQERHQQGLPIELSRVPSIHFGRLMLIRPEQYLFYSHLREVAYAGQDQSQTGVNKARDARSSNAAPRAPLQLNDYRVEPAHPPSASPSAQKGAKADAPLPEPSSTLRTWLLTLVEFDGDLRVYMRDIADSLGSDFDYIFENCEEYPGCSNFERFWIWIRRFQINTSLFYAPYSNLSVARIRQLEDFRNRFDQFVARVRSPTRPLTSIDDLFDEFLRETQQRASDFPSASGLFPSPASGNGS